MDIISVIVPVYNAENYLSVCIESIINQSYRNLEIIIVDDGSTDNSGIIADSYAKMDNRVRTVHTENHGLVSARKKGVENAHGEYVAFVDSDDYIECGLYENWYGLIVANQAEMVADGCVICYQDGNMIYKKNLIATGYYNRSDIEEIVTYIMFDDDNNSPVVFQSIWSKLFKRELLSEIICDVDERITMGEDAAVVYNYILKADSMVVCNECLYHYMIHENSMTTGINPKIFEQIYYFYRYMKKRFEEYPENYNLNNQLQKYLIHLIETGLRNNFDIYLSWVCEWDMYEVARLTHKKLILYGAGRRGKTIYDLLSSINPLCIVAVVDKQPEKSFMDDSVEVQQISQIENMEFDYIIIAVANETVAKEIKNNLVKTVNPEKILWIRPIERKWYKKITFGRS